VSSVHKTIGVTELQRRFPAVLDEGARERVPYVLARDGHPEAALISYDDFLRLQQLQEQDVLARFDRLTARLAERNADVSDEEVAADVAAALAEVRGEARREAAG